MSTKEVIRSFETMRDLIDLREHEANKDHSNYKNYNGKRNKDWLGLKDTDAVDEALKTGWKDGTSKALALKAKIAHLIPPARQIKRRRRFGDSGDAVDIQKVYNGNLETAWEGTTRRDMNGNPVRRILTGVGGSCRKTPEELFYKGVTAAILADILEEAGYRVEIQAYAKSYLTYTDSGPEYYTWTFPIKAADEPLDFDRLIAVTGLAGFFRYYIFRAMLSEPRPADEGLGYPRESPPDGIALPGDIVLNGIYSEEAAIATLKEELKKLDNPEAAA